MAVMREYNPSQICSKCKHLMSKHKGKGCNLSFCDCTIRNLPKSFMMTRHQRQHTLPCPICDKMTLRLVSKQKFKCFECSTTYSFITLLVYHGFITEHSISAYRFSQVLIRMRKIYDKRFSRKRPVRIIQL